MSKVKIMSLPQSNTDLLVKNILVPIDFSTCSLEALLHALSVARYYKAKVTLLHVMLVRRQSLKNRDRAFERAWSDIRRIEADLARGGLLYNIPHQLLVEQGDVWPVIYEILAKYNIDLIVTGTHGRTGLEILALGSFAEIVFRRASCPVLTVGPRSHPAAQEAAPKNVLFATDFSEESKAAEPYAFSIARAHGAKLTLVNVAQRHSIRYGIDTDRLSYAKARLQATALDSAARKSGLHPTLLVEVGSPVETILKIASKLGVGLIVLGASAPHRLASRLGRTVAYRIVCAAPCPVLTVRKPSAVDYFERLFAVMPNIQSGARRVP